MYKPLLFTICRRILAHFNDISSGLLPRGNFTSTRENTELIVDHLEVARKPSEK